MYIIGGKYKGRRIFSPKSPHVRPTAGQLREALFNICQLYVEGARFLDLFAGSGAVGLEALSRGASHVTFVEQDRMTASTIEKNICQLQEEAHAAVAIMNVLSALKQFAAQGLRFDIVYVDPPYQKGLSEEVISFFDTHDLLAEGGRLFIEEARGEHPICKNLKLIRQRRFGRAELTEYQL